MDGVDAKRIDHVAIVVKDLDAAIEAWSALLGAEPTLRVTTQPFDPAGTEYEGEPTDARIRAAVFKVGAIDLELMEPLGGPGVWDEYVERHGGGLHHIGFMSDSLANGIESLGELGLSVAQRAEYPVGYYAYFRSERQLGAMIELNELKGIPWPRSS
jgi:catechol 2,3-dioxygenase-like lactoylglutathione lyase family enzyme